MALERLDRLRHAKGEAAPPSSASRCSAPCRTTAAVFRTGEVLDEGVRSSMQEVCEAASRDVSITRPVADLEHAT